MSIHSRIIAGTLGPEVTLAPQLLILGEEEEEKKMALFETLESAVWPDSPLKLTSYLNELSLLLRLGCVESVPCRQRSPDH